MTASGLNCQRSGQVQPKPVPYLIVQTIGLVPHCRRIVTRWKGREAARFSAVCWAADHAVAGILGIQAFTEDDLYETLDDLSLRQEKIEQALYRRYLRNHSGPPRLFLYDVTSSYVEGG